MMCSHMLVAWMTAALPDGTTVGWWACRDCGHRFEPEPGNLEECRDEMVLEIDRLRAQLPVAIDRWKSFGWGVVVVHEGRKI